MKTILLATGFFAALSLVAWLTSLTLMDCMAIGFSLALLAWSLSAYSRPCRSLFRADVLRPTSKLPPKSIRRAT